MAVVGELPAVKYHSLAEKHLMDALNSLKHIVVERCPGVDDYSTELDGLRTSYHTLLSIRDRAIYAHGWNSD